MMQISSSVGVVQNQVFPLFLWIKNSQASSSMPRRELAFAPRNHRAPRSKEEVMPFKDRSDAGRQLAKALASYKEGRPIILALPRGGVPVAGEVAAALSAPVDLILVRKIGVPSQPELAMGAVVDGATPIVVRNEDVIRHAGIDESEFNTVRDGELAEIGRRRQEYLGSCQLADLGGHTAIVIDDGIATGATTRAAL